MSAHAQIAQTEARALLFGQCGFNNVMDWHRQLSYVFIPDADLHILSESRQADITNPRGVAGATVVCVVL